MAAAHVTEQPQLAGPDHQAPLTGGNLSWRRGYTCGGLNGSPEYPKPRRRFRTAESANASPDSTISRTRRLYWLETHKAIFRWVLKILEEEGLVSERTVSIDDGAPVQVPARQQDLGNSIFFFQRLLICTHLALPGTALRNDFHLAARLRGIVLPL